jgi:hypothetical protein
MLCFYFPVASSGGCAPLTVFFHFHIVSNKYFQYFYTLLHLYSLLFSYMLCTHLYSTIYCIQILLFSFTFVGIGITRKMQELGVSKRIQENSLNITPGKTLAGASGPPPPCVRVGDEAFRLSTELLLRPGGNKVSQRKEIFSYRLCRGRRFIDCTFGI